MDHREIAVRVPVMNEVQFLFASEPCKLTYSPKTPPVLSRVRSPWRPYHGRCRIDTKDQIGNEQDESSTKRAACRGRRDNRQSATVSSTTCFSCVPSADRVIRSLSLPPSPLRYAPGSQFHA